MKSLLSIAILATLIQRPPQNPTGIIEGMVTRTDRATPVVGALIEVEAPFPTAGLRPFSSQTTTDDRGRFVIRNVPAGEFTVQASLDGYVGQVLGKSGYPAISVVTLKTGQQIQVPGLVLTAVSAIRGRISDVDDLPVVDHDVQIVQMSVDEQGRRIWKGQGETRTNERGEYRKADLGPGEYYVRTRWEVRGPTEVRSRALYYPGTSEATALPITAREGIDVVADIRIPPPIEATGFKVSGRVVHAFPRTIGNPESFISSDPPVTVALRDRSAVLLDEGDTVVGFAEDNTGLFEIRNVRSGSYDLFASVVFGSNRYLAKMPIEVRDGPVEGLSLIVNPGLEVKAELAIDGPMEAPFNAAHIRASLGRKDYAGLFRSIVDENRAGITFPNVPVGEYEISVSIDPDRMAGTDLYVDDVRILNRSVYDVGIRVGSDPVDSLEIVIGTRGGSVEGTIPEKGNAAAVVILIPEPFRRMNPALFYRELVRTSGETFRFRGVPPGNYKIFAVPGEGEDIPFRSSEFAARYESRALGLTVQKGAKIVGIHIPLLK
jgi:Carboxypeptidase regulatory-like domain